MIDTPRCCSEMLESRLLFAGDVSVAVEGDDLFIRGDDAGNKITVTGGLGFFSVEPRGTTTVNGDTDDETFEFEGIDHVRIFLKGGKDTVQVDALAISEQLVIHTGSKRDVVELTDVTVGDQLRINTKSADDIVTIDNVTIDADAFVRLGAGDDELTVNDSTFEEDFTGRGKEGDDVITIDDDTGIDGTVTLTGGPGTDDITDESD